LSSPCLPLVVDPTYYYKFITDTFIGELLSSSDITGAFDISRCSKQVLCGSLIDECIRKLLSLSDNDCVFFAVVFISRCSKQVLCSALVFGFSRKPIHIQLNMVLEINLIGTLFYYLMSFVLTTLLASSLRILRTCCNFNNTSNRTITEEGNYLLTT